MAQTKKRAAPHFVCGNSFPKPGVRLTEFNFAANSVFQHGEVFDAAKLNSVSLTPMH